MKRSLSSILSPLNLRHILTCVASDLMSYYFKNNVSPLDEEFCIAVYSDPTLQDGECLFFEDDDIHKVFLCSNQYHMLSEMPEHVLKVRTKLLGNIDFNLNQTMATCSFEHGSLSEHRGYVIWSVKLVNYNFPRGCYLGRRRCYESDKIPTESLVWKTGGICQGLVCHYCKRIFQCDLHLSETKSEKCLCGTEGFAKNG